MDPAVAGALVLTSIIYFLAGLLILLTIYRCGHDPGVCEEYFELSQETCGAAIFVLIFLALFLWFPYVLFPILEIVSLIATYAYAKLSSSPKQEQAPEPGKTPEKRKAVAM